MWEDVKSVRELLSYKRYKPAYELMKKSISIAVKENNHEAIITFLRKEMILLNMSGDPNQTSLFCKLVAEHCLALGLQIEDYSEQCRVLNVEMDWYSEEYKRIVRKLHSLDSFTALHVILATFENLNQGLLGAKPTKLDRVFYSFYVYGMEADFESGISALNRMLKLWKEGSQIGTFKGKFKELPYVADAFVDLRYQLAPIIRGLNYLEWLTKEISLNHVTMNVYEHEVSFIIRDKEEFLRYKLPFIRDTARMQNVLRNKGKIEEYFGWGSQEIDYSTVIKIKESGDDFKVNIDQNTFTAAYKRATETAYQNHLLIIEDMYITNLHELKIKDKSISVLDVFFFYYCLHTLALIYFQGTKHFIQTTGKEARAPYLVIEKGQIAEIFKPILTTVLKRTIDSKEIDQMINLFTFGSDKIYDLYYKPLIQLGDKVIIIPSLFMMNNFSKTFLHHMKMLGVNLADRGDDFEKAVQDLLTEYGFDVYPTPMPYSYKYNEKQYDGDIDLIAKKGNHLFIGQLKNRLEPLEPQDYRGADKKIKKGVEQAEQAVLYINRNKDEFCTRFGISRKELDRLEIYPFVLVSCFYGSGQIQGNIPVIDASALHRFLEEGEIRVHVVGKKEETYSRSIRTPGEVLSEEFKQFLIKPYFLSEDVYGLHLATRHAYEINGRKFIIGPKEVWHEKYDNSLIAQSVEYFGEKGLDLFDDND
jgi:hypothetical protein